MNWEGFRETEGRREGKRLLLGDCGVNQRRGGCSIRGSSLRGERVRGGLAEEGWRDGGERNRPDKSGTKDKGKRREQNRNQKTIRRKRKRKGARGVLRSLRQISNEIEAEPNGKPSTARSRDPPTGEQLFTKNNPVRKPSEVESCRSAQTR